MQIPKYSNFNGINVDFLFQPLTIYHATQVAGLGSSTHEMRDKLYIHYLGILPSIIHFIGSKI